MLHTFATSNPTALDRFHQRAASYSDLQSRLRDVAAAGEVADPPEDRPVLLVRSRLLEAVSLLEGDLHGETVAVSAKALACAPLLLRFSREGRAWVALHVETRWSREAIGFEASLVYELNQAPF